MWKEIKDYPLYEVSEDGIVRRKQGAFRPVNNRPPGEFLVPKIKNEYYQVMLYNENGRKCKSVHRLVAEAFIPNPENLPQINHKDENKLNNRVDNLEWCTAKYNASYGTAIERRINSHNRNGSKRAEQPVLQIKDGVVIAEYKSISEAARQNNIDGSCIRHYFYGKSKSCLGCDWKKKGENNG